MKKLVSIVVTLVLLTSMFLVVANVKANVPNLPDYKAVDWKSGLGGKLNMPSKTDLAVEGLAGAPQVSTFASTPPVGTKAWDWYLRAISLGSPTGSQPWMTLRAISDTFEGSLDRYDFFFGSFLVYPRNDHPLNVLITDLMCQVCCR